MIKRVKIIHKAKFRPDSSMKCGIVFARFVCARKRLVYRCLSTRDTYRPMSLLDNTPSGHLLINSVSHNLTIKIK